MRVSISIQATVSECVELLQATAARQGGGETTEGVVIDGDDGDAERATA